MRTTYGLLFLSLSLSACSDDPATPPADTGVDVGSVDTGTFPDVPPPDAMDASQNDATGDVTVLDAPRDTTADTNLPGDVTPADASTDAAPADASTDAAPADASAFMALAPCNAASDYVPSGVAPTTITFGGAVGNLYSPQCATVRRGSTVTFSGAFSGHPLRPSTRGTSGNPIPMTDTGTTVAVSFPAVGFYPYYCNFHGTNAGDAMSGVIQVIE